MATTQGLLDVHLLTNVTSGQSQPIDCRQYDYLTLYVIGTGTISAGTLIVEESYYWPLFQQGANQGGWTTWATIPVIPGVLSAIDCTAVSGGAQQAFQFPQGKYAAVRVRIGTSISGGGNISVVLIG